MHIYDTTDAFSALCWGWRCAGQALALVPTMGYLHAGHASLIEWARANADRVAVSIFVNPSQFGPHEDLAAYPRDFERDAALCRDLGADALFAPEPGGIYDPDHATWVQLPDLAEHLCGRSRPVHFRGVATVVTKLLLLAVPQITVFGQKDWQQLAIVTRMARDLNIPTQIVGRPTVRESDGLAMSSRNAYLTPEERKQAPHLYRSLQLAADLIRRGERDPDPVKRQAIEYLEENLDLGAVDYFELTTPDTIQPVQKIDGPVLLAGAVYVGKARLIDNIVLERIGV